MPPAKLRTCVACLQPRRLQCVVVDGIAHQVCTPCRRAIDRMQNPARRGRKPSVARLLEPASENDRIWFSDRVGRNHRLRPAIGGEIFMTSAPAAHRRLVLVKQVQPGVRLKIALTRPRNSPPLLNAEQIAAGLWASAAELHPELELAEAVLRDGESRS